MRSRGDDEERVSQPIVTPVRSMPASAEPIPREEILKGSEYQPDQYVLVSKEELRSITPKTSNDIQILEFVHLREIDPVYLETSYYAEPESAGEKPYALLYRALRQTGVSCYFGTAVSRGIGHGAVVVTGGLALPRGLAGETALDSNREQQKRWLSKLGRLVSLSISKR